MFSLIDVSLSSLFVCVFVFETQTSDYNLYAVPFLSCYIAKDTIYNVLKLYYFQVKCMQCNYCSDKFDPFLDLSLEIVKADSLYKALAHFTAKEQLDGGERHYQCQQCKQKVKALKQLTIHKAPDVLTIHLKRFGSHVQGQKIDKKILFGPTLDLKPFVTGPCVS